MSGRCEPAARTCFAERLPRFAFIRAEKAQYPASLLCSLLEVSRSGYYAWCVRPPSQRTLADRELTKHIRSIQSSQAM